MLYPRMITMMLITNDETTCDVFLMETSFLNDDDAEKLKKFKMLTNVFLMWFATLFFFFQESCL